MDRIRAPGGGAGTFSLMLIAKLVKWIWPEALVHYVTEHDVQLPGKFVSHIEGNGWEIPSMEHASCDVQTDTEEWLAFCREQQAH